MFLDIEYPPFFREKKALSHDTLSDPFFLQIFFFVRVAFFERFTKKKSSVKLYLLSIGEVGFK